MMAYGGRAVRAANKVEFRAQPLANGHVEFLLVEDGREIFRAEFEPKDAGILASALLSGAYGVFDRSSETAAPAIGEMKVPQPIPTTGLALGNTATAGQKAIVIKSGEAIAAFLVNINEMRQLGRALIESSWKQGSNQRLSLLMRLLLGDLIADLRGWSGIFKARFKAASRRSAISFSSWISGRSLRLFRIIAIDPSIKPPSYAAIGECIYCDAKVYSTRIGIRSTPFGDEHIIAEGLGGKLELPEASCQRCEHITGSIVEQDVLLRTLKAVRLFFGIRGKARSSRPDTLPLQATVHGKDTTIDMPIEDYPVLFNMPIYGKPGFLTGGEGGTQITTGFTFMMLRYDERKLRIDYGITSAASPYWDTHMLYRMLAKIAHAFAMAELGKGKFMPALPDMILTGETQNFNHIGGNPELAPPSIALHELGLGYQRANGKNYVIATVRLFASKGGPTYHVVVGESRESAIARFIRVFSSRISRMQVQ
jgi:hypothetical protein